MPENKVKMDSQFTAWSKNKAKLEDSRRKLWNSKKDYQLFNNLKKPLDYHKMLKIMN